MKSFLILSLIVWVLGCKEPLDKNFEVIKDKYKVGYHGRPSENIFVKHNDDIGMMAVAVNKKIRRIGFNDTYAIVERVGNYDDLGSMTLDTTVVRYYIVDMTKKFNDQDKDFLFGPATYDEFLTRKKELGIPDLDFSKKFPVN